MVVLAVINRLCLAPRFFRDPSALRALGRTVALEQGLGLAVLAIVSVLGTLPPGLYGNG
jgi:putative copper export protein